MTKVKMHICVLNEVPNNMTKRAVKSHTTRQKKQREYQKNNPTTNRKGGEK